MIDQHTIEKIMDAADIVDVVSDFVELKKRGTSYKGLCPFHDDHTPSLSVSLSKGVYKCFSCGKAGNAVNFVMEHEQMTYVEALYYLAKKFHIEVPASQMGESRHTPLAVKAKHLPPTAPKQERQQPPCVLNREYIKMRLGADNSLFDYLRTVYGDEATLAVAAKYLIGSTKQGEAIFWQIDRDCRLRAGKIMAYNPTTGKRIKGEKNTVDWVHARLKRVGKLSQTWEVSQCLFGEHLLSDEANRNKQVAIVESEKTALIAAIHFPQYLWLATGGKDGLSKERCKVLEGRTVILFPDVDAVDDWKQRAAALTFCKVAVHDWADVSEQDMAAKVDIADLLLRQPQPTLQEAGTASTPPTPPQTEGEAFYLRLQQKPLFRKFADKVGLILEALV